MPPIVAKRELSGWLARNSHRTETEWKPRENVRNLKSKKDHKLQEVAIRLSLKLALSADPPETNKGRDAEECPISLGTVSSSVENRSQIMRCAASLGPSLSDPKGPGGSELGDSWSQHAGLTGRSRAAFSPNSPTVVPRVLLHGLGWHGTQTASMLDHHTWLSSAGNLSSVSGATTTVGGAGVGG
ncbi:hypothetical protein PAAG_04502 [Paracoccidioides lutzii Pb01]|uniref:Uncharacterized protein n=1 Tax=Paracoccidioides lutzii (strain ATCC MYA-826 / Pb01) TaxID=502779 RepID=C1H158_PARBA|nr:hypothetical protein PAAG_04502 [Paracoccidioides lutzii Pb01]EEH33452.2 hypothetical protein PAAG_04502 [Paracoccidioides lutzii Pb01]